MQVQMDVEMWTLLKPTTKSNHPFWEKVNIPCQQISIIYCLMSYICDAAGGKVGAAAGGASG